MLIKIGRPKNVSQKKEESITKEVFDKLDSFVGGGYGKSASQIKIGDDNFSLIFDTKDSNKIDVSTLIFDLKQITNGEIEVL